MHSGEGHYQRLVPVSSLTLLLAASAIMAIPRAPPTATRQAQSAGPQEIGSSYRRHDPSLPLDRLYL
jgi:hypothetical protein